MHARPCAQLFVLTEKSSSKSGLDSDGKNSKMTKKRKLDGKDESTMFRLVMDNFKSGKIYSEGSKYVRTTSASDQCNLPVTRCRNISVEDQLEGGIVSDLPEGWRRERVKMGKNEKVEVITSGGLRITSQAAMDIHTRLHQMPDLRLDWQDMVVLPRGVRFELEDPVVLEIVPADNNLDSNMKQNNEHIEILEQVARIDIDQDDPTPCPSLKSDQSTISTGVSTALADDECEEVEQKCTETILEMIRDESNSDDDCFIVESTETTKEEKKKEPALGRIPFSQRFFSL